MRIRIRVALLMALATGACWHEAAEPDAPSDTLPPEQSRAEAPEPARLTAGTDCTRTLRGGEAHRFSVPLAAGHTLRLSVEQRGIDLILEFREVGS